MLLLISLATVYYLRHLLPTIKIILFSRERQNSLALSKSSQFREMKQVILLIITYCLVLWGHTATNRNCPKAQKNMSEGQYCFHHDTQGQKFYSMNKTVKWARNHSQNWHVIQTNSKQLVNSKALEHGSHRRWKILNQR